MPFSNPILAGEELVRPAIRSPNFVAGVSGWSINRDGTAEFADATIRGSLVTGTPGINLVEIENGQVIVSSVRNTRGIFQAVSGRVSLSGKPADAIDGSEFFEGEILWDADVDERPVSSWSSPVHEDHVLGAVVTLYGAGPLSARPECQIDADFHVTNYNIGCREWRYKTGAETRTNQVALFTDPDIFWSNVQPGVYDLFLLVVARTTNVANDANFNLNFAVGAATGQHCFNGFALAAAGGINAINESEALLGGTTGHGLDLTNRHIPCHAIITVTSVGDLEFRYSQNPAAAGTSIIIDAGTRACLERIG